MTWSHPYGVPQAEHAPQGPLAPDLGRATAHALASAEAVRAHSAGEVYGDFYPRLGHANGWQWECLVAAAERSEGAVAFASGMAAMHAAVLGHCGAKDRVLVAEQIYGGTEGLVTKDLPRFGVEVERFDALDPGALARGLERPARLVLLETPINPTLRIVDLVAAAALCRKAGALLVVDGTFAPPPVQFACGLGADLVVHSATKFYGGHTDVMAGVVAGTHAALAAVVAFRTRSGGVLAADPAWLLCRSMATHALRVERQQQNARICAEALAAGAGKGAPIEAVSYPGLAAHPDHALAARQMHGGGGLVTVTVRGGLEGARATFERLRRIARAPSLGGVESVASIPRFTTHARVEPAVLRRNGIADGMLRLSIGVGDPELVIQDLRQAVR